MGPILNKVTKTVIGLMPKDSQSGIDAALLSIRGSGKGTKINLLAFENYPYPKEIKEKLHELTTEEEIILKDLTRLNFAIGKVLSDSAKKICEKANIPIEKVDLIGSYGQMLIHLPEEKNFCGKKVKATLQIGEPSIIAKKTGVLTVADFRPCDIALEGGGAPLTAYTDYLLFSSRYKNRAVISIGEKTSVCFLPKNCSLNQVKAFDINPGTRCVNEAMNILYDKDYDKDGRTAGSGKVNKKMLKNMLDNVFFKSVLKSKDKTGLGEDFVEEQIDFAREENIADEDIIATLTEFSAYLISENINKLDVDEAILCGDVENNMIMKKSIMKNLQKVEFKNVQEFGMTADNKDAIAFAILANETVSGNHNNLGEKRGFLGKIILP